MVTNLEDPLIGGQRRFVTTRWSLVLTAGNSDSPDSRRALADLCSNYWYPLYMYARRRGYSTEDAKDLTQAFFVKLLEKKDLAVATPDRGRFRTFLLTSMKNFLAGEWRKENALKRGGGVQILALDFDSAEESYKLEPSHEDSPEALYERGWAMGLLERGVADLKEHYVRSGRADLFEALEGTLTDTAGTASYAELAERMGQSEGSLRTAASRLRSRWRKRLRQLVAETVSEESQVEDELRALISSLG